jgi:hypothetical protein
MVFGDHARRNRSRLASSPHDINVPGAVVALACGCAVHLGRLGRLSEFEGYPAVRLLRGHVPGIGWHTARRRRLWDGAAGVDADPESVYFRYPLLESGDEVLPTTLGNILLAGERYSWSRYGMDIIYFWPRLYPLLPERFQAEYEEFVINSEFPLVVAFEAMVVAALGGLAVLFTGGSPVLFVLWFLGGSLIAYAFYLLSFSSAEELAEQQRTAFDLYRHLLLEQWPTPADVRDENEAFKSGWSPAPRPAVEPDGHLTTCGLGVAVSWRWRKRAALGRAWGHLTRGCGYQVGGGPWARPGEVLSTDFR